MILWIFWIFHIFISITCQNYCSLLKTQYMIHISYSRYITGKSGNLDVFLFPGEFNFQLKLQESLLKFQCNCIFENIADRGVNITLAAGIAASRFYRVGAILGLFVNIVSDIYFVCFCNFSIFLIKKIVSKNFPRSFCFHKK